MLRSRSSKLLALVWLTIASLCAWGQNFQHNQGPGFPADVNGDGFVDYVSVPTITSGFLTRIGSANGTFTDVQSSPVGGFIDAPPEILAIRDLDQDGKKDIFIIPQPASFSRELMCSLGTGDGHFGAPLTSDVFGGVSGERVQWDRRFTTISLTDLNGDGRPDVLMRIANSLNPSIVSTRIYIAIGTCLYNKISTAVDGTVQAGDFNGDGKADLARWSVNGATATVEVLPGNNDGTFSVPAAYAITFSATPRDILVGRLNAGNVPDFAVRTDVGLEIYTGSSNGITTLAQSYAMSSFSAALADMDGDGNLDVAVASQSNSTVSILRNSGTSQFAFWTDVVGAQLGEIRDVNGDSKLDIAFTNNVYLNVGNASSTTAVVTLTPSTTSLITGDTVTLTANVTVNGAAGSGTVFLLDISPGTSMPAISGTLTNGTFQYTTTALSAGTHSYSVSYGGASNVTGGSATTSVTVNKAATSLAMTADANPSLYGQTRFTVSATGRGGFLPTGSMSLYEAGVLVPTTATLDSFGVTHVGDSGNFRFSIGAHDVLARYGGDSNFTGTDSQTVHVVVGKAEATPVVNLFNTINQGDPITLTITVNHGNVPQIPTGTVTIREGTTQITVVTLVNGGGTYTTSTLSPGTHTFAADYSGDSTYAASTSFAATTVVPKSVAITPSQTSATVRAGQSAVFNLQFAGAGGLTGNATFSCSNLPALATCEFSPSSLNLSNTSQAVVLTIRTTGPSAVARPEARQSVFWATIFLPLLFAGSGRKKTPSLFLILTVVLLASIIGCGGGGSSTPPTTITNPSTPAGTTAVMVTATANGQTASVSNTITLNLTVTP